MGARARRMGRDLDRFAVLCCRYAASGVAAAYGARSTSARRVHHGPGPGFALEAAHGGSDEEVRGHEGGHQIRGERMTAARLPSRARLSARERRTAAAGWMVAEAGRRRGPRRKRQNTQRYYHGRQGLARVSLPVAASLVATASHHAIKGLYHRKRPLSARVSGKSEPSFPSGHAMSTTAVSGVAAYLLLDADIGRAGIVIPAALAVPLTVGFARVYTGRHRLSDVVAGWIGGVAIAAACGATYDLLTPHARRRRGSR